MIVTKEQQEQIIDAYISSGKGRDECLGFIEGMEAMLHLIIKIEKKK